MEAITVAPSRARCSAVRWPKPELVPVISGEHTLLYSTETTVEPLREMCRAHGYDPNSRTEVLAAQIAGTHAGDYFAFLCYFTPDEATEHIMHDIQRRLRNVTKRAVTVGYGPRYLHSTGQLHKGGGQYRRILPDYDCVRARSCYSG